MPVGLKNDSVLHDQLNEFSDDDEYVSDTSLLEQWTEGIIIPLYKKGNKKCANNYLVNNRLETFCKANDRISDTQLGFRKGNSTVDAMFALLSTIQNN